MNNSTGFGVIFSALASVLGACSLGAGSGAANHELPLAPVATIQELMSTQVDPSADVLWASVSTVVTAAGTEEKQPRTDAEWQAVRRYAVTLIEATNLLAIPNRRVAALGGKTEDSAIPGIESPENIQKAIDGDRASFIGAVARLREAGIKALAAVDKRNPQALIEAGGDMDSACESCHLKYWYPHSPRPK